ncbi:MAG: hypothetical protein ACM3Y9_03710 [Ignavibacteria bacterium]
MKAENATTAGGPVWRSDSMDPTGEVNLADPAAVERTIKEILDRSYAGRYDEALLSRAIADAIRAYRGDYPGLLACDTLYHDLRHALETGLTTARLLDGYAKAGDGAEPIDGDHALLAVLLAIFHDVGLLRRTDEADLWGPVLIPVHEERGVEFMTAYLSDTGLAPLAGLARLIMPTKLTFRMPADWPADERRLAAMIASADLLSQCADRCYLEKCRDFLYEEFTAFGLAGKPDSPYPDPETLLAKTPAFFTGFLRQRLDEEFGGIHRVLEAHMGEGHPWMEAIDRTLGYLETLLPNKDFSRLRRRPERFV